ncbi:MAG: dUTP diphosphatase [Clostridiales Family XIII bacterium]|jgi:dUTP pyrophosphatase|nr:dUTP diphosphatase [Clostridiales Family XIII bacterium]
MAEVSLEIKKLYEDVILPTYATSGSAGLDLRAYLKGVPEFEACGVVTIPARERRIIPTGIAIALESGYEAQVRARSGLAFKHGIMLTNGIGTIDSDYRGEIKISLYNSSDEDFVIHDGDRIAQLVIARYEVAILHVTNELQSTQRGEGGFGHTGKK